MLSPHRFPAGRAIWIVAVALSTVLTACDQEAPPRAPIVAVAPASEVRVSEWLVHLSPTDRQFQEAIVAVAASGDDATRRAASQRLVAEARTVTSPAWREAGQERLREANAATKLDPTSRQLEAQLDEYRNETLERVLAGMERVGGVDAVAYAFELAENDAAPTKVRQAALAVLAKQVDGRDTAARARASAVWERVAAVAMAKASAKPPSHSVANAAAVVAGMAAGFRRCYNQGLQEDPNMVGSVRVTAKIGPQGEVLSVSPSSSGLSEKVVACVAARVAMAVFSPPEGGGATVVIPVTFVTKDPDPVPQKAHP